MLVPEKEPGAVQLRLYAYLKEALSNTELRKLERQSLEYNLGRGHAHRVLAEYGRPFTTTNAGAFNAQVAKLKKQAKEKAIDDYTSVALWVFDPIIKQDRMRELMGVDFEWKHDPFASAGTFPDDLITDSIPYHVIRYPEVIRELRLAPWQVEKIKQRGNFLVNQDLVSFDGVAWGGEEARDEADILEINNRIYTSITSVLNPIQKQRYDQLLLRRYLGAQSSILALYHLQRNGHKLERNQKFNEREAIVTSVQGATRHYRLLFLMKPFAKAVLKQPVPSALWYAPYSRRTPIPLDAEVFAEFGLKLKQKENRRREKVIIE